MLTTTPSTVVETSNARSGCNKPTKPKTDVLFEDSEEDQWVTNEIEENYPVYEDYFAGEKNDLYTVPLFDGEARIMARTRLPAKRFDIWAEVSAVCGNGALVSASGVKDYLWVGFAHDRAILRWTLVMAPWN